MWCSSISETHCFSYLGLTTMRWVRHLLFPFLMYLSLQSPPVWGYEWSHFPVNTWVSLPAHIEIPGLSKAYPQVFVGILKEYFLCSLIRPTATHHLPCGSVCFVYPQRCRSCPFTPAFKVPVSTGLEQFMYSFSSGKEDVLFFCVNFGWGLSSR